MARAPVNIRLQCVGYSTISRRQEYIVDHYQSGIALRKLQGGGPASWSIESRE
ncbi:hypothetical protein [Rhizorhabdus phycosphaerae]|uniref:hypothetical protein n=1 Tax=Rhizorhabdus phycosphaerae TaxID=2711156 RepID=UPI0013ECB779|nr:hypothetical protein [Rhizorhabdus phycosphaerae]